MKEDLYQNSFLINRVMSSDLTAGSEVMIQGLEEGYNGKSGVVLETGERFKVQVGEETLLVEPGNLVLARKEDVGAGREEEGRVCAICYDPLTEKERAELPCCGNASSTVQYCTECIQVIIERVPPEHCPESWGRREEWLESIRQTRRNMGAAAGGGREEEERVEEQVEEQDGGGLARCVMM
ncbi:hypothetical protein GUITHDRAFT_145011 [Guillardia theta CCMP2712]|uniref:Uncharacterized protein n=1 Tax=Guillardia theta (strain CCMP2712) TaxID=905079 RepID=L1INI5_GUITC|nr:hypothetical protein GUITHDRAFT_145011 [Guillardia theta CCMP2712]EKX37454.1 hypothetical protein GUITHDRAFT_145011 [Guillardia theta CCMP2712]|eukprot:XP_005824434.1 hypothetical protein GUITHDRAFT_145011 [Guillardia theta CCMP2712]